jgi:Ca2+-binding EF-hand superfamily protein
MADMDEIVKSVMKKAFIDYDLDGSGFLERPEMRRFVDDSCKEVKIPKVSEQHLDKIINAVDTDRDGKISYAEFTELMKGMLEKQLGMTS